MEVTVKQRLIKFIRHRELSQGKFEKIIGAGNGFVNNISKSIGAEKLQSILCNFPEINADWLLYGEGEMLKTENISEETENNLTIVPLLPISAQGGSLNDFIVSVQSAECERITSPIAGVDFAMPISGNSMSPDYPSGSQVLEEKLTKRRLLSGVKPMY